MKYLLIIAAFFSLTAQANLRTCKNFEITMKLQVLSKLYFLRTMSAEIIEIKKGKATLQWDSGFVSKKWKFHKQEGMIQIKSKKLKEVFETYEDSTSNARYVQLMNFVEDHEDEDDFRFTPVNEAAPFMGNDAYPNQVGEYKVSFTYSDCQE